MRLAIISDLHANAVALEAALAAIARESVDRIICLGDVASDGPQPRETLQIVKALGCPVIMGNADAQLLGLEPEIADPALKTFAEASRWCANAIACDERAFVESFAPRLLIDAGGASVSLFHGSPHSYNDEIYPTTPDETLTTLLADHPAAVHIGGHTHFQMFRHIDAALFVNPGSIGMTYDRTRGSKGQIRFAAWAEFAVLELAPAGWNASLRRVPFDIDKLIDAIRRSGMPNPDWWAAAWSAAARL